MRQGELQITDPDRVAQAKPRTGQISQICLGADSFARRKTKHLFIQENEEAMMRFDRGMSQDQVIVLAAAHANHWLVIIELNGTEHLGMVDELKHSSVVQN